MKWVEWGSYSSIGLLPTGVAFLPYLFLLFPKNTTPPFWWLVVGRMLEIGKKGHSCDPHKKEPPESFPFTSFIFLPSLSVSLRPCVSILLSITSSGRW
jgi:hypothetical protein